MANLNFDSNQWYHIYYNQDKKNAFTGGSIYNRTNQAGSAFFQGANLTQPDRQWQFFAIDSDFFALRTKASGSDGFLGTGPSDTEETFGKTVPRIYRTNVTDDSAYWKVTPWGDGTFFLSNKANKTAWHLTRKPNHLAAMTSNVTGDQPFQQFSFETISAIDNDAFSTINLPTATKSSPSNSSHTNKSMDSSNPPNTDPTNEQSGGGLSNGAKAGIGVGIGLVALIILVVLGLFLWRWKKRQQQTYAARSQKLMAESEHYSFESGGEQRHEMSQTETAKYEVHGDPQFELPATSRPMELPGGIQGRILR